MAKLIFPQEIEVWYILPAVRKKLALKLAENMPQKNVAKMMGITPAAVSQYKKQKRAKKDIFDAEMEKELIISVKKIINKETDLAHEIMRLNNLIKSKGLICEIYKKKCVMGDNQKTCPFCKN